MTHFRKKQPSRNTLNQTQTMHGWVSFNLKDNLVRSLDKENIDAHPASKNPHFEAKSTPRNAISRKKKPRNTLNQTQIVYEWVSLNLKDS